jgi:hypothetical protein
MNRICVGLSNESCSCNNCSARNYVSRLSTEEDTVKIYQLQIGSACINLCGECLEKLCWHISDFMGETK